MSVQKSTDKLGRLIGRTVVVLAPWVISMYVLYWLEYGQVWTLETPHRGKSSVIILLIGMGLSFFLYSRLFKRDS